MKEATTTALPLFWATMQRSRRGQPGIPLANDDCHSQTVMTCTGGSTSE
jgi:hypothetical protein